MKENTKSVSHEAFLKRFKSAKSIRDEWQSTLERAYDLFLPNRQGFTSTSKGQSKTVDLYTDVGVQSLTKFSNNIKTKLMPSQQRWAKLQPSGNFKVDMLRGSITEEQRLEVQNALDIDTEIMFHFLWSSNFDVVATESLKDMGVSTGAFMIQDNGDPEDPLNFVSVPADQLVIEEAPTGDIRSAWREWTVKAREVDNMWPDRKQDSRLNKHITDNPEKDINVIEGTVYNPTTDKYDYLVYINVSDCKAIFEASYDVSPWVIFRWDSAPQETWGRGPAISSLHTMGSLNQLEKDKLSANAKAVNPIAIIDPSAIINPRKVSFNAGSRIIRNSTWNGGQTGNKAIEYLDSGSNLNVASNFKAEYEAEIKDAFYIMNLPPVDAGAKTATEYQIRSNEALEQQNAAFTRLQKELIEKTVARVHSILSRYNLVGSHKVNNKEVSVKATSPLSMYQDNKDIQDVNNYIITTMQTLGESVGANVLRTTLDIEKYGSYTADKMGIPTDIRLTPEKRAEVLKQIQQEAIAQQQQQQAEAQAQQSPPQQVPPQ